MYTGTDLYRRVASLRAVCGTTLGQLPACRAVCIPFQLCFTGLKVAMVRVASPQKLANAASQAPPTTSPEIAHLLGTASVPRSSPLLERDRPRVPASPPQTQVIRLIRPGVAGPGLPRSWVLCFLLL